MNEIRAFYPFYYQTNVAGAPGGTAGLEPSVTVAATDASSTSARFSGNDTNNSYVQIQVANLSTSWAYVNFGPFPNVAAAAVATSYPVAPGSVVVVSVSPEVSQASVILGTAAATGNVIFTRGAGL